MRELRRLFRLNRDYSVGLSTEIRWRVVDWGMVG